MKELTLQELKSIEFEILKMFDAFCKENNIRYYLAFGTLLGAIRYKKFIPWDDDVDVLVPRDDYDRLIKLFKDSEKYQLFAFEKNSKYPFPFAKLCDMTTRKIETVYNTGITLGVDIDIFPLDAFDSDLEKAKNECSCIMGYMRRLGYTKANKPDTNSPIKFAIWSAILVGYRMVGAKYYVQKIIGECRKEKLGDSAYVGAKAWCIWGERGIIPARAFEDSVDVEFEGQMFPAPVGYDEYLTCLYGDYLPEPPKEKQKTHHYFRAYKL